MALSLKSNSKTTVLSELLLEKAKGLREGQRLPTVKEIMAAHKVSRATVVEAIDYLKQMGYVEATVGRGTFLKKPVAAAKHVSKVDMIFFGAQENFCVPSFHNNLAASLQEKLEDRGGWLHITVLRHNASWCDFVDAFDRLDSEAVMLASPPNADIYYAVARRQVPFVNIFPNFRVPDMTNTIQIDNLAAVKLWVKHLTELGHSKIAHLHSADLNAYSRDHHQRLHFFYQEMAAAGLLVDPRRVIFGGYTPSEGYQATKELLSRDCDFTAVICGDDNSPGVYQALQEAEISIPQDVSIIGIDGTNNIDLTPGLTTLSQTPASFAELAIDCFDKMFSDGSNSFANIETVPTLLAKDSTDKVRN